MSNRTLTIMALALFALTVVARAPARWLVAFAPRAIECQLPTGSAWQGECARLRAPGLELAALSWRLHPWSLLRGRFELEVHSADARAPGVATIAIGFGRTLSVRDLRADVPLDSGFLPLFPAGWTGQLRLELAVVEFTAGRLSALRGTIVASSLQQKNPAMPFGSFELQFAGAARTDGVIVGNLRDLGGPLAVSGTLTIRNGHDYELAGLAAARADATPELAKAVEFLGPADAQGRRAYSLAGTF